LYAVTPVDAIGVLFAQSLRQDDPMNRFRIVTLALTLFTLFAFAPPPFGAAQQLVFDTFPASALVRGENIRLRLDPAAAAEVLELLQRGDPITITGESVFDGNEEYYPVESDLTGEAGWIAALFIDPRSISGTSTVVVPIEEIDVPAEETETVADGANQRQQNREARRAEAEPELAPEDSADDRAARRAARQAEQDAAAAEAEQPADDRAARRAARPAQQDADADEANASADTLTFSGTEPTVTPEFTPPSDVLTVTANYEGDRNFVVLAVTPDGTEEVLFDERGPFSGETTFETDPATSLVLDVDANGPWEVTIELAE
jgi:hypothetical protein